MHILIILAMASCKGCIHFLQLRVNKTVPTTWTTKGCVQQGTGTQKPSLSLFFPLVSESLLINVSHGCNVYQLIVWCMQSKLTASFAFPVNSCPSHKPLPIWFHMSKEILYRRVLEDSKLLCAWVFLLRPGSFI